MFDPRLDPPRPSDDRSIGSKILALGCGMGLGILILVALIVLAAGGACYYIAYQIQAHH
jgi:hypothetical protein